MPQLPQTSEPEANIALGLIAQLVRDHEPRYLPQAELEVTVVAARGLAAMDANGSSDPYAVLHCGPVRCRTRCVPKTLDPHWGESFRFEVVPGPAAVLQVDVYDHDVFSNDDFLGTLRLKIDELMMPLSGGRDDHAGATGGAGADMGGAVRDMWQELHPRPARDAAGAAAGA